MDPMDLTAEQRAIIEHPPEAHATVLAVAGSGKTTTMVHRIGWLVAEAGVRPALIRAVMYNVSARADFEAKLADQGLDAVRVQTFHAMGWGLLRWAVDRRILPPLRLVASSGEHYRLVRAAIAQAREEDPEVMGRRSLDADLVMEAVAAWKATLTPPERAEHADDARLVCVYRAFEARRYREGWLTYDDQVYEAVRLLQRSPAALEALQGRLDHFVVDEFQDVNPGRLELVKLLSGERARVMVVGDDDQCIYEWQGARSGYLRGSFEQEFPHHGHARYALTTSFRFGPLFAQLAYNLIRHNQERVPKALIAHELRAPASVELDASPGASSLGAARRLEQLFGASVTPSEVVVLCRKYSQTHGLQAELIHRRIPFFVDGAADWRRAPSVRLALSYLELVEGLNEVLTEELISAAVFVVNRPVRYVKQALFEQRLRAGMAQGRSLGQVLSAGWALRKAGISGSAPEALGLLAVDLRQARSGQNRVLADLLPVLPEAVTAGQALEVLLERVDFAAYLQDGERANAQADDLELLEGFSKLLAGAGVPLGEAGDWLQSLDTCQGQPREDCVRVTSVFKAKGLEWPHVLLPDLTEGQHPDLRARVDAAFDRDATQTERPTDAMEGERRLFYVALTRAQQGLYLFADDSRPSRFVEELALKPTRRGVQALLEDDPSAAAKAARLDPRLREGLAEHARRHGRARLARRVEAVKPKAGGR